MSRTRIVAVSAAVGVTAAMAIGSGPAQADGAGPTGTAAAGSLTITVQPKQAGNHLLPGFVGLSFGAATVAKDDYANTDFGGFLRMLGHTGTIRIGANSGDGTFWTSTGETPPSWATSGVITPLKLQHVAAITRPAGWKVILAVNLKHPDVARAVDEVKYATQIFGDSLEAIEIGNEPNFYYANPAAYYADFETYATAIHAAVPGIGVVGPEAETNHSSWLGGFATAELTGTPDVAAVTDHTYPTSACGTSTTSIPALLGTGSVAYEQANAQALLTAAAQLHAQPYMTETNSTVCAGEAGVSDVFAAALWALDYNLMLAQDGVVNAEFMGGTTSTGACDPYTPLCPTTGDLTPRPVYYGLLATELVGTGRFVSVSNPDSADMRAYALTHGNRMTVVLDNVQDPASNGPTTVTLDLGANFCAGRLTALTTTDPAGLSAKTGITLGGQQVGAHGAFGEPQSTPVSVHGHTATVTVPAGSAAIIQFN